jgi:alpha-galactosidase
MRKLTVIISVLAMVCGAAHAKPLKVYILVGQSNMQGMANISTAGHMAADAKTKVLHDKLIDAEGKAKSFDHIRIAAFTGGKDKGVTKSGPLTFGYGKDLGTSDVCGPELGFGITMYERLEQPILIIKTAWGGKSLYGDFRPPSAGYLAGAEDPESVGHYYRLMTKHVKSVLADPGKYHPAYKEGDGYQIAGFVWFQGWNDMVARGFYKDRSKPGGYDAYTSTLVHFINDVRKEFNKPQMPFVIGVLGVGGPTELFASPRYKGVHQYFRNAMAAPAKLPEFKGNVHAVLTERFWPHDVEAAAAKARALGEEANEALKAEQKKNPELTRRSAGRWRQNYAEELREKCMSEAELLAFSGLSNAEFHYVGSMKFYSQAGEAFAKAILDSQ